MTRKRHCTYELRTTWITIYTSHELLPVTLLNRSHHNTPQHTATRTATHCNTLQHTCSIDELPITKFPRSGCTTDFHGSSSGPTKQKKDVGGYKKNGGELGFDTKTWMHDCLPRILLGPCDIYIYVYIYIYLYIHIYIYTHDIYIYKRGHICI